MLKNKADSMKMVDVIYKVQCKDCPGSYTGETSRSPEFRLKEHHANAGKVSKARTVTSQ